MELFDILLLVFFVLLPLIGAGRRKRKGDTPSSSDQGDDAPRHFPGRERPPGQVTRPGPRAETSPDRETNAADMVPDDLWEVLTGEPPRQSQSPEQAPEPGTYEPERRHEPAVATAERAGVGGSAGPTAERAGVGDSVGRTAERGPVEDPAAETAERGGLGDSAGARAAHVENESEWGPALPDPAETKVVSLEQQPLPPEVRKHLALSGPPAPPGPAYRKRRRGRPSAAMKRLGLGSRSELRRAVILREVLGTPKGLQ